MAKIARLKARSVIGGRAARQQSVEGGCDGIGVDARVAVRHRGICRIVLRALDLQQGESGVAPACLCCRRSCSCADTPRSTKRVLQAPPVSMMFAGDVAMDETPKRQREEL